MTETIRRHVHEALFFTSPQQLQAESVPFLREGLEAGADAVLACSEDHNDVLSQALGGDARLIRLQREQLYRKPVTALETIRDFLRDRVEAGSPQVRVVCEVDFGATARSHDDWGRFESVVNEVLEGFPLWTLCAYDVPRLPEAAVRWGRSTHPWERTAGQGVTNPDYRLSAELLSRPPVSTALPEADPLIADPEVRDLRGLGRRAGEVLQDRGVDSDTADDFVLALNEVATNGLRHGTPPVSVRVWLVEGTVVCAVTDRGPGIADPVVGYVAGGGEELPEGRFGLWLARRLCDEVDTLRHPHGFTVRMAVYPPSRTRVDEAD